MVTRTRKDDHIEAGVVLFFMYSLVWMFCNL